jgi:large subunit ribosomal protein L7/L12
MNTELSKLSQLEKLKRQKEIIEARIQQAEARHKQRERKEDTRRKILLGAYFLEKLKNDAMFESIKGELDSFLTRNSDRKLFGLSMLDNETAFLDPK